MGKYDHIDFKPPESVAKAAEKGLEYRKKQGKDKAGLTPEEAAKEGIGSGVQRAVNLKNRDNISPKVIKQMVAFFSRHEKNKAISPEHKNEPWKDKGYVAWLIWGGDPGKAWAEKVLRQMEAADKKVGSHFTSDRAIKILSAGGIVAAQSVDDVILMQDLANEGYAEMVGGSSQETLWEAGPRVRDEASYNVASRWKRSVGLQLDGTDETIESISWKVASSRHLIGREPPL